MCGVLLSVPSARPRLGTSLRSKKTKPKNQPQNNSSNNNNNNKKTQNNNKTQKKPKPQTSINLHYIPNDTKPQQISK